MNPELAASSSDEATAAIGAIADTCVKCGLCIERCPSYRVLQREQDSPRGRIALAAALASGMLVADDASALAALDRCLNCGTCTRVCPANVDFNRLIDLTRATFPVPAAASRRAASWLSRHRGAVRALRPLARSVSGTPLRRVFAPDSTGAALLDALASADRGGDARPLRPNTAATATRRGSVALFRGCVAGTLDAATQQAAAHVLARLGFEVHSPDDNHCCGALDRHHGNAMAAAKSAIHARACYRAASASQVLGTVTGCHAQLRDQVFADSHIAFEDLFAFLDRDEVLPTLAHRPVPLRVAMHVPCTQRDVAGVDAAMHRVLARIPALEILRLPEEPGCCGAAGTYFADHPRIANALRAERVEQIQALAPTHVLSSNIGCRMHLAAGLTSVGVAAIVVHPIALLELALRQSPA